MMQRICVYCGSNSGNDPAYSAAANELAAVLVDSDLQLVYGGAPKGTMGILADAVLERGGVVHGVIPKMLEEKEIAHTGLTELHVVASMHERKSMMAALSDGFIALPGGFGTLEELIEIIEAHAAALASLSEGAPGAHEMVNRARERARSLDLKFLVEESRQLIQGILDGADRTARIVGGLRVFGRMDGDQLVEASLAELLEASITVLGDRARNKARIEIDFDVDVPALWCHSGKLSQVFMNIIVNAVAPGLVQTPWTEDWSDLHAGIAAITPMGRSATPDDCARAVRSCIDNLYMTGAVIVVDGGTTLVA